MAPSVVFCGQSSFLEQQGVASVVEELPTQGQLCTLHVQVQACGRPSPVVWLLDGLRTGGNASYAKWQQCHPAALSLVVLEGH